MKGHGLGFRTLPILGFRRLRFCGSTFTWADTGGLTRDIDDGHSLIRAIDEGQRCSPASASTHTYPQAGHFQQPRPQPVRSTILCGRTSAARRELGRGCGGVGSSSSCHSLNAGRSLDAGDCGAQCFARRAKNALWYFFRSASINWVL